MSRSIFAVRVAILLLVGSVPAAASISVGPAEVYFRGQLTCQTSNLTRTFTGEDAVLGSEWSVKGGVYSAEIYDKDATLVDHLTWAPLSSDDNLVRVTLIEATPESTVTNPPRLDAYVASSGSFASGHVVLTIRGYWGNFAVKAGIGGTAVQLAQCGPGTGVGEITIPFTVTG